MSSSNAVPGMRIYYGQPDVNNGMNWILDPLSIVADTLNTYAFYFDSLGNGWMNIAQLYPVTNPVSVSIAPVIDAERGETVDFAVYLLFPSINSVMNVINTSVPENIVANNIPDGMQAVAVVLGVGRVTKKAYFGKANFTVTPSQNISISVTQQSDQQIDDALTNL